MDGGTFRTAIFLFTRLSWFLRQNIKSTGVVFLEDRWIGVSVNEIYGRHRLVGSKLLDCARHGTIVVMQTAARISLVILPNCCKNWLNSAFAVCGFTLKVNQSLEILIFENGFKMIAQISAHIFKLWHWLMALTVCASLFAVSASRKIEIDRYHFIFSQLLTLLIAWKSTAVSWNGIAVYLVWFYLKNRRIHAPPSL
jgi:hypothetical protein